MAWNENLEPSTPAYLLASDDAPVIRAVAGPGSGKSFAIKRRISRLLEQGVDPSSILAITFTRTAAQDLNSEISSLGIVGADQVHSRTIHSHALKILMQNEVLQSTQRFPRIVIDHEIEPALYDLNDPIFGSKKEKRALLDSYLASWATLQSDNPGFERNEREEQFSKQLTEWLTVHKGILIGEVIYIVISYLRNNPASSEIGKYHTILVDEYQDLNRSEQEFIRLIRGSANMVIVGDDDQSIYSFKYAHPEGIKEIDQLFGEYSDVVFSECRRCPQQVTRMASELISHNTNRTLGSLIPFNANGEGDINIIQWTNLSSEIAGITHIIIKEIEKGKIELKDILILTPRRLIGYKLRDELGKVGLHVRYYFKESIISNKEVRKAYSLMYLLYDFNDSISWRYLLGSDSADYKRKQYEKINSLSRESEDSISETIEKILLDKTKQNSLSRILQAYKKIKQNLVTLKQELIENPQNGIIDIFVNKVLRNDNTTEIDIEEFYELNQQYIKAINNITSSISEEDFYDWYESIFKAIKDNITIPEPPEEINHIRIMSLHSSKGLSAKFVVICSMIDNLMPYIKDDVSPSERERYISEARRLFYVAVTRCKSADDYQGKLIVSSFLSIEKPLSMRLGLSAGKVRATRYMEDFKNSSPNAVAGSNYLID